MKLVDTSAWTHQLRAKGDPAVRERVEALLRNGEAAWCAPVRIELWSGVGREPEGRVLRQYAEILPDLEITAEVWRAAEALAERGRRKGFRAPAMDILIAACARHYGLEVEHDDRDFEWLMGV
jgi:predicted nucleic acid-binding protein